MTQRRLSDVKKTSTESMKQHQLQDYIVIRKVLRNAEITEMTENFTEEIKYLTELKETLIN